MKTNFPLAGCWLSSSWITDRRISDPRPIACRTEVKYQGAGQAVLRISSCEYYILFINGKFFCRGPARSTACNKAYDEVDIAFALKNGTNAVALLVTIPTGEISHRGRSGWWCDCRNENGELLFCTEKKSWKCRTASWYCSFSGTRSLSSARQEHIQLALEEKDWKILRLDDLPDTWNQPFVMGPADWTPPYRRMRPRGTAMPQYLDLPCGQAVHYTAETALFPLETLADSFNSLSFAKQQQTTAFDGRVRAGDVYTFDLGKTRTFIPEITVIKGCSSIRLESFCDICHFDRPRATSPFETAGAGFADSCELADDSGQSWIPIVPCGGRFWSLRAAGTGECEISLRLRSLEYPYEKCSTFVCSDAELEKFIRIADDTLRSATQDVFVDTCWREQALWTRDAAVAGPSAFYLFGDLAVWKESLRLIGESICGDGIPAAVAPAEVSHLILADQTFCWINSLEQFFMISGDESFISEMRQPVMNFLRLMRQFTDERGLFAPPVWSWHFIDWADVDRRPWSLAINAMLYSALDSAVKLFNSPGADGEFLSEFRELSRCGLSLFWDEKKGYFLNHLDGAAPELAETIFFCEEKNCPDALPVHGNALLLAHGLFPGEYRLPAAEMLAKWLLPAENSITKFGTSWFPVIAKALFGNGQSAAAWELLRQRYGTAVEKNAPTYGEKFPFDKFNSAHGWSTGIAEILLSTVWGIKIIEPGFRKISTEIADGLPKCEMTLHTPAGIIHLSSF